MGIFSAASQAIVHVCNAIGTTAEAVSIGANTLKLGALTMEGHAQGMYNDELAKIAAKSAERAKLLTLDA